MCFLSAILELLNDIVLNECSSGYFFFWTCVFSYFSLKFTLCDVYLPCVYWRVIKAVRWCLLWLWFEADVSPGSFPTWPMSSFSAFEQLLVEDFVTQMWIEIKLVALSSEALTLVFWRRKFLSRTMPTFGVRLTSQRVRFFVLFGNLPER